MKIKKDDFVINKIIEMENLDKTPQEKLDMIIEDAKASSWDSGWRTGLVVGVGIGFSIILGLNILNII